MQTVQAWEWELSLGCWPVWVSLLGASVSTLQTQGVTHTLVYHVSSTMTQRNLRLTCIDRRYPLQWTDIQCMLHLEFPQCLVIISHVKMNSCIHHSEFIFNLHLHPHLLLLLDFLILSLLIFNSILLISLSLTNICHWMFVYVSLMSIYPGLSFHSLCL